jgi:threonine aldolase
MTAPIDLRSDTVTRPSPAMRRAMADADVGDDVLDGDPTTRRLETRVAELLGKEAALFFPSGTQANQTAIGLLVPPGAELVLEASAHLILYEMGAVAALWGAQTRPVAAPAGDGRLTPEAIRTVMRPRSRFASYTAALAVENTHNAAGGAVLPLETMAAIRRLADDHQLPVHLDGARLWNAAAALEVKPAAVAADATTVMVSLSKGLGCPVGSCLAGPQDLIAEAWTLRKRLGGGMRQSGILAAAGLFALEQNLGRIADDHAAAHALADGLAGHPAARVVPPETNIVMIDLLRGTADVVIPRLADAGVLVVPFGPTRLRAVTHLDVTLEQCRRAATIIGEVLERET